jgi:hypothetical protein
MDSIIDRICEVDREIAKLMAKRNLLVQKAVDMKELCKRGKILSDLLVKASTFENPYQSTNYVLRYIIPMKDFLPIEHFPCTVTALAAGLELPRPQEASRFLLAVSTALGQDRVAFAV